MKLSMVKVSKVNFIKVKGIKLVILAVFLFMASACEQNKTDSAQSTIALVNDESIRVADLIALLPESDPEQSEAGSASPEERAALSRAFLDQLIEQAMLLQEAERLKIKVTEKELNTKMAEYREGMDQEEFLKMLSEQNLAIEDLKQNTRTKLLIEKLLNRLPVENREKSLDIPETAVRAYYEEHRQRWQIDVELKLRQILVKTQEEAEELYLSVLEGADFDALAKAHSKKSQAGENGDLGYLQQGETPIEFDPLFHMEVGKISHVIRSPFGYHIVKVEDRREQRLLSYEAVREKIYKVLLDQRRERAYAKWISRLKERTEVRINEELLKKYS